MIEMFSAPWMTGMPPPSFRRKPAPLPEGLDSGSNICEVKCDDEPGLARLGNSLMGDQMNSGGEDSNGDLIPVHGGNDVQGDDRPDTPKGGVSTRHASVGCRAWVWLMVVNLPVVNLLSYGASR